MADRDILVTVQIQDAALRSLGKTAEGTAASIRKADQAVKGVNHELKNLGSKGVDDIKKATAASDNFLKSAISIGAIIGIATKVAQGFDATAEAIVKAGEEARKAGKSIEDYSNGAFTKEQLAAAQSYTEVLTTIGKVGDQVFADLLQRFDSARVGWQVLYNRMSGTGPQTSNGLVEQEARDRAMAAEALNKQVRDANTLEETQKRIVSTLNSELAVQKKIGEEAKKRVEGIDEAFGKMSAKDQNATKAIDKKIAAGQKLNPYELDKARDLGVFQPEVQALDRQRGRDAGAGSLSIRQRAQATANATEQTQALINKEIEVQALKVAPLKADEAQVKAAVAKAIPDFQALMQAEITKQLQAQQGNRRAGVR